MIRFATTLAALALATPLAAADLSDRYEVMGTMTAQIGEESLDLVIPYDTEDDSPYGEQKMIMGSFLTINLVGAHVDEDGTPGRPMLQVTLQKQNGTMGLLSVELFDDQGYDAPLSIGMDGGEGELVAFAMDDTNTTTGRIEGNFLRLTGYTDDPRVADGAEPIATTIEWRAELEPLE